MAIKNYGVDIATAVDVEAAIYQDSFGADVYIVGGWRPPFLGWYGAKQAELIETHFGSFEFVDLDFVFS
jgi:hypothetical protein